VPVSTGTFVSLHLAVSYAEVLLRVLEEHLDTPSCSVGTNHVLGRCFNLVRGEVVDRVLFVFVGFFPCDDQLHVSQLRDGKFLYPDVVSVVTDIALNRVDAHSQRIGEEFFASVRHLLMASKRADSVPVVGFDVVRKARIVSEPRVEEVGVRRHTYLFFEFDDGLSG